MRPMLSVADDSVRDRGGARQVWRRARRQRSVRRRSHCSPLHSR